MGRPFVVITLAYVAGLLLAPAAPVSFIWLFGAASLLLIPALAVARSRAVLVWPLLVLAGWTNYLIHTQAVSPHDLRRLLGAEPALVTLQGRLAETPRLKTVVQNETNAIHAMVRVEVSGLRRDSQWVPANGLVLVTAPDEPPPGFFAGQPVEIAGVMAPPPRPLAEGLFDFRDYLAQRGIHYELKTTSLDDWRLREPALPRPPISDRFLKWSRETLAMGLPADDGSLNLIWAMTLDWRTSFTGDISEPFLLAGTMHMFAIDGLRIALLAGAIVTLLRALRLSRAWCGAIALPIIWFYSGATGWESSAIRASVMMTVILGGWALKRPADLLNSLAAAAFILLLWDPCQLWETGFQLSFIVVGVIAVMLPPLEAFCDSLLKHDPLLPEPLVSPGRKFLVRCVRGLARYASMSFTAWVGSIPLCAKYFHLFNPISTRANLVAVPLGTLALIANLCSLVCGHWLAGATVLFNHAAWGCMTAMTWVSIEAAKAPGAYCFVSEPSLLAMTLYYAAILGLFGGWLRTTRLRIIGAGGWLVVALVCCGRWAATWPETELTVLPLPDGHAVYVDAPGRMNDWLINAGDEDSADHLLKPFLRAHGVNRIPGVLLTDGSRHVAGGAPVLDDLFGVGELWTSRAAFRSLEYRAAVERFEGTPDRHRFLRCGDNTGIWQVLHPADHAGAARVSDDAVVLLGRFHDTRILLLSDLSRTGQDALLAGTNDLHADIVVTALPVVGEPLCAELMQAIQPKVIVIADSEYPASNRAKPQLKQRLDDTGIPVIYTRIAGAVMVVTGKDGWQVRTMDGQRYASIQKGN